MEILKRIKSSYVAFALFLIDLFLKRIVKINDVSFNLFLFKVKYVINRGTIWGLFNSKHSNTVFIIITMIVLFLWIKYKKDLQAQIGESYYFILYGILSNFTDRIQYGFVIDYIDFGFWPVFNIGDAMISISITFIIAKNLIYLLKRG